MAYTNSPLVSCTKLSPNNSGARTHSIDRITPHCVVGQCSAETIGNIFVNPSYQASSNYGIGYDGRVGMYVEEKNRSWCSSSYANDQRAVTIECASDATAPYTFRDVVYQKLIALCVDICKRNGKKKLLWFGDKTKTLNYSPASDEMILTVHRWFANKSCPGDWMYSRMGDLAAKVTAQLNGENKNDTEDIIYIVQAGDSLSKIAAKYNTTYQKLAEYNNIKNPNIINVGQKIKIPQVATKPTTPPAAQVPETNTNNKGETINMELRLLSKGMNGNDVHAAMVLLKDKGYYPYAIPATDKQFGPKMDAGVRKMQKEHNLGVDGIIGAKSWTFLLK